MVAGFQTIRKKAGWLSPISTSSSLRPEEAFDRIILTNYYRPLLRKVAECLNAVEPSEIEPTAGQKFVMTTTMVTMTPRLVGILWFARIWPLK